MLTRGLEQSIDQFTSTLRSANYHETRTTSNVDIGIATQLPQRDGTFHGLHDSLHGSKDD